MQKVVLQGSCMPRVNCVYRSSCYGSVQKVERKGGGIVQIIQEKKRIEQTYFSICSQKHTCLCGLNKVRLVKLLDLVLYRKLIRTRLSPGQECV